MSRVMYSAPLQPARKHYGRDFFKLPKLGFSHSRCVSKCIFHALPDMARNFYAVSAWPRHERNLVMPDFATYSRDCIAECQDRFWIPCGGFLVWFFWFGKIVRPPIGDSEKREKR